MANNPPRHVEIKGQDHMLSYITPEEGGILQLLGGSGAPGPMGIPSYFADDDDDEAQEVSEHADDAAASQAEAEAAMGLGPFSGQPSRASNTNMGLDDDIAAMMGINAGISRGMKGIAGGVPIDVIEAFNKRTMMDPMTGKVSVINPGFGKIAYDPLAFLQGKISKHIGKSMSKYGVSPEVAMNHLGQVTGTRGQGGHTGFALGLTGLAQNIGNMLGASTITGYGFDDDEDNLGDSGNDDQDIVNDTRTFLGEDTAEIEDYKVAGKSFIDPALYKYLQEQRVPLPVGGVEYVQDTFGSSSANPVDFSAIDRGLQQTRSGIGSINRNRY